jgi:lysophospholipase L1-like esterase
MPGANLPRPIAAMLLAAILVAGANAKEPFRFKSGQRVLFLGDSITHAGGYVAELESRLRTLDPDGEYELINLGLPSETCSGLSEPAHPYPRPNVHERLARALSKIKPDVVFACYGMNDGIYHPFSKARFAAYQKGIDKLVADVKASGATLILLTPPPFDPLPLRKRGKLQPVDSDKFAWFQIYEDYDSVLAQYANWIMVRGRTDVDDVIDLHTPINAAVAKRREKQADFTMSGDGVHLDSVGHLLMANVIWRALGYSDIKPSKPMRRAVAARAKILHDAWLSHVGHKRPGVKDGLPIDEAKEAAAAIKLPR